MYLWLILGWRRHTIASHNYMKVPVRLRELFKRSVLWLPFCGVNTSGPDIVRVANLSSNSINISKNLLLLSNRDSGKYPVNKL